MFCCLQLMYYQSATAKIRPMVYYKATSTFDKYGNSPNSIQKTTQLTYKPLPDKFLFMQNLLTHSAGSGSPSVVVPSSQPRERSTARCQPLQRLVRSFADRLGENVLLPAVLTSASVSGLLR